MGLKNWIHNKRMSDPVDGTLQLTACSRSSGEAVYSNCMMQGVVTAPGLTPTAVEHRCMAPTRKWPQPGQAIPVRVDRTDPTRLEVRWDAMPSNRDRGLQRAQAEAQMLAARMRTAGPPTSSPPGSPPAWGPPPASPPPTSPPLNAVTSAFAPGTMPPQLQALVDNIVQAARNNGAYVTVGDVTVQEVPVGDATRQPGEPGGGLTLEQAMAAVSGGAASMGLTQASATVLAVHDVDDPVWLPGVPPGGGADITLDVALPGGGGYSTTTRVGFSTPEKRARVAVVGATLPVLVNPGRRDQIIIDTSRMTF